MIQLFFSLIFLFLVVMVWFYGLPLAGGAALAYLSFARKIGSYATMTGWIALGVVSLFYMQTDLGGLYFFLLCLCGYGTWHDYNNVQKVNKVNAQFLTDED